MTQRESDHQIRTSTKKHRVVYPSAVGHNNCHNNYNKNNMIGKSILIEGFEATGKSTLAQRLSEHFQGSHLTHLPKGDSALSQSVYELAKQTDNESVRRALLLATHIENQAEIRRSQRAGDTLIVDRGLLSFYAYQWHSGYKYEDEQWDEMTFSFNLPQPKFDHVFVLTATKDKIRERLDERGYDTLDRVFLERFDEIREGFELGKEVLYPKAVEIDTTYLTAEQTFEIVLRKMGE